MGPSGCIGYILHILDCLGQVNAGFIQVLYLGRAPRTKETLPDFREKCRVTRYSRVFRGLTGSQRTPGFGALQEESLKHKNFSISNGHIVENQFFIFFLSNGYIIRVEEVFPIFC